MGIAEWQFVCARASESCVDVTRSALGNMGMVRLLVMYIPHEVFRTM